MGHKSEVEKVAPFNEKALFESALLYKAFADSPTLSTEANVSVREHMSRVPASMMSRASVISLMISNSASLGNIDSFSS